MIFGEQLANRIARLGRHPEFPWAPTLTIPDEPLFNEKLSTVPQAALFSILNAAYVLNDSGTEMSGTYEDKATGTLLSWRMELADTKEELDVTNGPPMVMSLQYNLYISGRVRKTTVTEYKLLSYETQEPSYDTQWVARAMVYDEKGGVVYRVKRLNKPVADILSCTRNTMVEYLKAR